MTMIKAFRFGFAFVAAIAAAIAVVWSPSPFTDYQRRLDALRKSQEPIDHE